MTDTPPGWGPPGSPPPGPPANPGWGPPGFPPPGSSSANPGWAPPGVCYRHPDRVAGAMCRRCGRPICPDCMREAPVGWQCASCVKEGAKTSPVVRWRPRGGPGTGPRGGPGTLGRVSRVTPVTAAIAAINVICYIVEQINPNRAIERFGMLPIAVDQQHQWYRLFTSAFLHVSVAHIALNMITLLVVGPAVETAIGRWRFAVAYVLSLLGGSVAVYLFAPIIEYGVGASGAIFGILGAYFVLARRNRWDATTIVVLIVVNLAFSFAVPGVEWRDHIGGLVVGGLVTWGLLVARERSRVEAWLGSAAVITGMAGVLALLSLLPPGQ